MICFSANFGKGHNQDNNFSRNMIYISMIKLVCVNKLKMTYKIVLVT